MKYQKTCTRRLNFEATPLFFHFTHDHPLELTTTVTSTTTCAGCGLAVATGREFFMCKTCGYALHRLCSGLPYKLHHPCHPSHELNLRHGDGDGDGDAFHCNACARRGAAGFSYNCQDCGIALHVLCSLLPPHLTHQAHLHSLKLEFSSPYDGTKDFQCDLCGTAGSNHWLYRCNQCEYNVHLGCAIATRTRPNSASSLVINNTCTRKQALDRVANSAKSGSSDHGSSSSNQSTHESNSFS